VEGPQIFNPSKEAQQSRAVLSEASEADLRLIRASSPQIQTEIEGTKTQALIDKDSEVSTDSQA
jgi:hypothetical protein